MDLERIKQNLRIRSGRNKLKKKPVKKTNPSSEIQKPSQPSKDLPNGHIVNGDQIEEESEGQKQDVNEASGSLPPDPEAEKEQAQDTTSVNGFAEPEEEAQPEKEAEPIPDNAAESIPDTPHIAEDTTDPAEQDNTVDNSNPPEVSEAMAEQPHSPVSPGSETEDFDLKPSKPRPKPPSIESLSELLFSSDHLNALLHNPPQLTRFSAFLQKYMPGTFPLLSQYLETQKAIKAVEYANAVAYGFKPTDTGDGTSTEVRKSAATLDPEFEAVCTAAFESLVGKALPQYITYQLIKVCSECLTDEIVGRQSTAVMQDLVGGLSEVFCLTDPHQEDNPIIYASEEFYRLTGYGEQDVIGNNCRFLQGKKTNPESHKRLKSAIEGGDHIYETLLNYRRDGKPFINVLLIAPLYDKDNKVKYHIGAQVDVSGLVEGGRALPGFQRFLNRRDQERKREDREKARGDINDEQKRKSRALARLRDLSEMFDLEESAVVRETSRANSLTREDDDNRSIASMDRQRTPRRVLADSDNSDDEEAAKEDGDDGPDWKLAESGDGKLSGKLPGIYDSFMLFRPYPSLRIVFLSPKLQKFKNVLQTPVLSHVAAPGGILGGLTESLKIGVPVLAKVHFTPERGVNRDGTKLKRGAKHEDGKHGKAIWMSCTPLLGQDERIGVWMCVVVEKAKVIGLGGNRGTTEQTDEFPVRSLNKESRKEAASDKQADPARKVGNASVEDIDIQDDGEKQEKPASQDVPIKPVRMNSQTVIKTVAEQSIETSPGRIKAATITKPDTATDRDPSTHEDERSMQQLEGRNTEHDESPTSPVSNDADESAEDTKEASNTPVRGRSRSSKPYSVDLPSCDLDTNNNDVISTDEYVATRSTIPSSTQLNGRVVIEDDSDVPTDGHTQEDEQDEHPRSTSTSPVWSPASEVPPSIPSDAQFSSGEELDTGDSASQKRESTNSSQPDQTMSEGTEEKYEDKQPEDSKEDVLHLPQAEMKVDAKREQKEQESEAQQEEEDSIEPVLTPTPATPNENAPPPEEDGYEEDETLVSRYRTESEEDDERPVTAVDVSSSGPMDYLKAGTGRWQQGRNPRRVDLTQENFHLAGLEHRGADDWFSDVDCARSPYSVD